MKLGRLTAKRDPRVMALSKYTRALSLPPPPAAVDYYSAVNGAWPMNCNDRLGCCVVAGIAHLATLWTVHAQTKPFMMSDAAVEREYSRLGGYVPGDPSTDRGLVVQDAMQSWIKDGIDGDRLDAMVSLNMADLDEIRDAIFWFGGVNIGINCPRSALENTARWDVVPGSPIQGGHDVILAGYDRDYFYTVSWGKLIPTTPGFLLTYIEEAFGAISRDFITQVGTTPGGLSLEAMIENSKLLKGSGK